MQLLVEVEGEAFGGALGFPYPPLLVPPQEAPNPGLSGAS